MKGWREDRWTEHLLMTTGDLEGRKVLFINIYAPTRGASRVKFFKALNDQDDCDVICGGDFNCAINGAVDKAGSHRPRGVWARELASFLDKVGLVDHGEVYQPENNGTEA
jgi:hypothetical protein